MCPNIGYILSVLITFKIYRQRASERRRNKELVPNCVFFSVVFLESGNVSYLVCFIYQMNKCDNESVVPYRINENSLANRACVGKKYIQRCLAQQSLEGLDARIKILDWFD